MSKATVRVANLEDIPAIQAILDEPSVAKGALIDPTQPVNIHDWFEAGGLVFMAEGGCFVIMPLSPFQVDAHTLFLPGHRGNKAFSAAQETISQIFTSTDTQEIFTKVHRDNRPVQMFTGLVGFDRFCEEGDFVHYRLSLTDWLTSNNGLETEGEAIREALGVEMKPLQLKLVGFVSKCIKAGLLFRAIGTYNVWAALMGWQPLQVLSLNPTRIHAGDRVLTIQDGHYQIEEAPCQLP